MSATPWPASRACAVCSEPFFPKATVQVYCSTRCRERAKYDRKRNDPERWDNYLARLRAAYQPTGKPPGPAPTRTGCDAEGCGEKHFARGFCRRHYARDRYRRGLDRRMPVDVLSALVKHYDVEGEFVEDATSRRLVVRIGGRLLVPECPDCGLPMMKVPTDDDMDLRDCGDCRVRVLLNSEEVSWLTSGEPSTERSRRTVNSSETSTPH